MSLDREQHERPRVVVEVPLPPGNDPAEVALWAVSVMQTFGLAEWRFGYNRRVRSLGLCRCRRKRIELSVHLVRSGQLDEIKAVMLHEVAHGLVGPGHGHDAVWKAKAVEIGARPERCSEAEIEMPKGRWAATCGGCNVVFRRHRRPRRMTGWHCRPCGREKGTLLWKLSSGSSSKTPTG